MQAFGQACLSQPGCPLQRLDLSDCEAGDAAAVALASALMEGRQAEAGGIPQGGHQSGPEALMGAGGMPPSPSNQNPKGSRTGPLTDLNLSANQFTIKGVGCGVWIVESDDQWIGCATTPVPKAENINFLAQKLYGAPSPLSPQVLPPWSLHCGTTGASSRWTCHSTGQAQRRCGPAWTAWSRGRGLLVPPLAGRPPALSRPR